jgi:hypothetical protein
MEVVLITVPNDSEKIVAPVARISERKWKEKVIFLTNPFVCAILQLKKDFSMKEL